MPRAPDQRSPPDKEKEAAALLGVPGGTYRRWRNGGGEGVTLDIPTMERLSLLLGIYKDLEMLLPREESADTWVSRPNSNPLFGGQPPVKRMLGGLTQDLVAVRQHLDAQRGGWA